jgi:hypothetical protein
MTTPSQNEPRLDLQLTLLRRAIAEEAAPDYILSRLQSELGHPRSAPATRPRPASRPRFWLWPPAAALTLTAWFAWVGLAPGGGGAAQRGPAAGAFIALSPLETIALYEAESRIVSTEVPRIWLVSAGVAVAPERAGEPVRIDLLVGGGKTLAVRIPDL